MEFKDLQRNWDGLGKVEPWESIVRPPGYSQGERWNNLEEFFATGDQEVASLMQYIEALNVDLPSGGALDFGCGAGRVTLPLSQHFEICYGVDIAPSMIELAEHYRSGERCRYVLNQREDLSFFSDDSLAFVYSVITFQNMAPCYSKKYIREFMRILKPGGLTIFQVPSMAKSFRLRLKSKLPRFLLDLFYWVKYRGLPRMEVNGVPKWEVIALLEENGARIIDIQSDKRAFSEWSSFRYCAMKDG
jgi:ubiquinone/menaquinone biosynthesis C-methylase UbiE